MSEQLELVPVTRPNGKVYRPTKPPRAFEVDWNHGDETRIVVLGTHDADRAYRLAESLWGSDVVRESATRDWMRRTIRQGDPWFAYDTERGAPAVIFEVC